MILGTAGHVDHGKTALVRALTGVDTDRLEEEKRRGITIDLGFAPLALDGLTIGVVDVPGHEAFVRNMLAGATGVDLALLVVAADEGVMPQTREHLAILSLLGIRGGVIALTKCDLVDDEWIALVSEDVRAAVRDTPLADAALIHTSIVTNAGLDALRRALESAVRALPARDADDLFRMPVDRAFSVRGTGTVVTGTVWSGALARDATVRILPGDRTARVRGIESHGVQVERAVPGTRTAIALAGIDVAHVARGALLVSDDSWIESGAMLGQVALLDSAPQIVGPRTALRFHLGTVDVGARIVTRGGPIAPGERKGARIVVDPPIAARAGDRFVLRGGSPLVTVGGGVIDDPSPAHRRSRPSDDQHSTPSTRLLRLLDESGRTGVLAASLPVRIGATPSEVIRLLDAETGARRIGDRVFDALIVRTTAGQLERAIDEHHERAPLDAGAPLSVMRSLLAADNHLVEEAIRDRLAAGTIVIRGSLVMRRDWVPRLSAAQASVRDAILDALSSAGREPPSTAELSVRFGEDTAALLRLLERDGSVVPVDDERYYASAAVSEMVGELRAKMKPGEEYGPADLRELVGGSRKFLIPFLEFCDRSGVTERRASGRVLGSGEHRTQHGSTARM